MSVHRFPLPGRRPPPRGTRAMQIVAEVRAALFEHRHRPGDFLGTEKTLAARFGVSRIVARDALRSLEAMGVVEIRAGSGGGARISRGNPQLFAEALAVQLELSGIAVEEIVAAQHAVECLAAEAAAERAGASDLAALNALLERAEEAVAPGRSGALEADAFTRLSLDFHLAVADASRNRVLHYQLVSLQHVSWPARNRTLTRAVARRVLEAHRELVRLIAARDAAGARKAMDAHVRMIGSRRVSESGAIRPQAASFC